MRRVLGQTILLAVECFVRQLIHQKWKILERFHVLRCCGHQNTFCFGLSTIGSIICEQNNSRSSFATALELFRGLRGLQVIIVPLGGQTNGPIIAIIGGLIWFAISIGFPRRSTIL